MIYSDLAVLGVPTCWLIKQLLGLPVLSMVLKKSLPVLPMIIPESLPGLPEFPDMKLVNVVAVSSHQLLLVTNGYNTYPWNSLWLTWLLSCLLPNLTTLWTTVSLDHCLYLTISCLFPNIQSPFWSSLVLVHPLVGGSWGPWPGTSPQQKSSMVH